MPDKAHHTGLHSQAILTCRNLSLERDKTSLLKNISVMIPRGMCTVIIGHNGAGKTLLMQALHGIVTLSTGQIDAPARQAQKMVFQKPVMLRRTAGQNFDFICPGIDPALKGDWFGRAGLRGRMHLPARLLSGGEQQKLAIISALAASPELLFLDEPSAHLDFEASHFVETELLAARARGMSVVMSSHSRSQAQRLADYILLMKRGRLAEFTEKDSFFTSPSSDEGREYLALT